MVPRPSMNRCSSRALRRGISSTLVFILPRAPSRIFSGWGVTRNVSNRSLGCCARQHYGWSKATRRPRRVSMRSSPCARTRGLAKLHRRPHYKLRPGKKQKKTSTVVTICFLHPWGNPQAVTGLPANPGGLLYCRTQLRDRISLDNWHIVQRLAHTHEPAPQDLEAALTILDQVLPACTALAGYAFDDMTRDDAWRFL